AVVQEKAPEPAAAPALDGRIRDLLQKVGALMAGEIAEKLNVSDSTVSRASKPLVESGVLKSVKRGRATAYYLASLNLRPEYELYAPIEAVTLKVLEPEARHLATKQLASSFVVFAREEIASGRLAYLPLYKVRFSATVTEGWFFK